MAKSRLDIAQLLINSGANVNVTDNEGCVPLHAAAKIGYREIAELLLGSSNASLDARNRKQETPLGLSCSKGKPDMALFLIDHGSDTTRLLLDHDTDADRLDDSGCTPLHVASHEGHDEIIQLVFDHGADPNHANSEGSTSLHVASQRDHDNTVRLLLHHGIVGHRLDGDGWASLHLTSQGVTSTSGLEHGTDSNHAHSTNGLTPLYLASQGVITTSTAVAALQLVPATQLLSCRAGRTSSSCCSPWAWNRVDMNTRDGVRQDCHDALNAKFNACVGK